MDNLLKITYLSWIFWQIGNADKDTDDITTLAISVQKFYSSPSIVLVFNKYGFEKEKILLDIIKDYSRQNRLSQVISFGDLNVESKRLENALYVLYIQDKENLEHAINVTKKIDTSSHPWLLVSSISDFNCDAPGKDFFKLRMDSKMTAKCKGDNVLKRYYSIFANRTEVVDLAVWTSEKKLKFKDQESLTDAQTNMKGMTLKIANRTSDSSENKIFIVDNFSTELIQVLKTMCNFEIEQGPQDDLLGDCDSKTKKWDGLIGIISNEMADIASALFSMSNKRMEVVDYVIPLTRSRSNLYAKIPDYTQVNWDGYFKAFNENAKITIYISILIFSILICLMTRRILICSFFENFINIWGIYTQQGIADQSSRNSIQILYLSILLWSLILQLIYSACFTSYVTVLAPQLPFNTYQEFEQDNTYGISVIQSSSHFDLIMSSKDMVSSSLKRRLKKSCLLPKNAYDGFLQACNEKIAFYNDDTFFDGLKNYIPCQLGYVKMQKIEFATFVLTKNSPYTKIMSYSILRLSNFGILKRLMNKYSRKITEIPKPQFDPISLTEVYPILTIWTLGLLMALLVLSIEISVSRLLLAIYYNNLFFTTEIKAVKHSGEK